MQPQPRLQAEHGVGAPCRLLQEIHQPLQALEMRLRLRLSSIRARLRVVHPPPLDPHIGAPASRSASVYGERVSNDYHFPTRRPLEGGYQIRERPTVTRL